MKKKLLLSVLSFATVAAMGFGFAACGDGDGSSSTGGSTGGSSNTGSSAVGSGESPVITIMTGTETMSFHVGDEELATFAEAMTFGVTATDAEDGNNLLVIVSDDDGFDAGVPGTYVITYSVTDADGNTTTATRTVVVEAARPAIIMEVREDKYWSNNDPDGDGVHDTLNTVMQFPNKDFMSLSATPDEDIVAFSGIIYNATNEAMTVNVTGGGYGEGAIVDANGIVVEGRDGMNAKLVNAANPVRTTAPANSLSADAPFANMTIPAKGYAVMVLTGTFGEGPTWDGRQEMAYQVIHQIGNIVKIYWQNDVENPLTTYVDQAPEIITAAEVSISSSKSDAEVRAAAVAGISYRDDNGTFAIDDDVTTGYEVTVKDVGEFVAGTEGTYTFTLEIEDANGNKREFTRSVKVVGALYTLTLNAATPKTHTLDESAVVVYGAGDTIPSTAPSGIRLMIIKSDYNGTTNIGYKSGAAMRINKYGELVGVYDGANGGYYTYEGATFGERVTGVDTYAKTALERRDEGDVVIIAINYSSNQDTRAWVLGCRFTGTNADSATYIGTTMSLSGVDNGAIQWETKPVVEE